MKSKSRIRELYNKICDFLSFRNMTLVSVLLFLLLLLPVCYLSFYNRASGDDYSYGQYTRAAIRESGTLAALSSAIWRTIRQYWYGWQGTWFSITLFTLQPEVFRDDAYVIVAFLMLFCWIGSTFYLFQQLLRRQLRAERWEYLLVTVLFLLISIEFIPSTKSAIFWYNGCAHYLIPFAMCQMVIAWGLQYCMQYKKRYLMGLLLFMTLLGGANYQAALLSMLSICYIGIGSWFSSAGPEAVRKRRGKLLWLLLPVGTELMGLLISMKAPGNAVRAGEGFGFSLEKGLQTIGLSFLYGVKDIGTYLEERPLIFVGLLLLFLLFLEMAGKKDSSRIRYPLIWAVLWWCLYSAMQAPALYAGVEVSRGVLNTNFQVFLLVAGGELYLLADFLAGRIRQKWKEEAEVRIHRRLLVPGLVICLLLVLIGRSGLKNSTTYACLTYLSSGQAADYREQMRQQTALMEGEEEDVVLPFINDDQGPLMHMPVTDDPTAWTNRVTSEFYGKNSTVAMDRPTWKAQYGEGAE